MDYIKRYEELLELKEDVEELKSLIEMYESDLELFRYMARIQYKKLKYIENINKNKNKNKDNFLDDII